jgi:hypothetical protein
MPTRRSSRFISRLSCLEPKRVMRLTRWRFIIVEVFQQDEFDRESTSNLFTHSGVAQQSSFTPNNSRHVPASIHHEKCFLHSSELMFHFVAFLAAGLTSTARDSTTRAERGDSTSQQVGRAAALILTLCIHPRRRPRPTIFTRARDIRHKPSRTTQILPSLINHFRPDTKTAIDALTQNI